MKSVRTDYHVHPGYSIDASPVEIRDYCRRAVELGLREICFTTHFEFDPVRRDIDNFVILDGKRHPAHDLMWLEAYFKEIEDAQREFKDTGLKVKAGIEVGYDIGLEREIERVLKDYPFDFVLGAIHCLDHIAISSMMESPQYFASRSPAEVREDYFTTLREAVNTGFFDCIAHLDLYKRYGIKHYGSEILTVHRGVIEPILKEMARRNMGLEINTSSLRRGVKEFHPSREIISLAVEAGVTIFTVGSDAHSPEDLGDHIDEALALLEEFGLCNHVFTKRRAVPCVESAGSGTGGGGAVG
ncbi:MAG: histidinol-phosphatase [Peptococcaceae bacterium]|nr:histidinol-phosphatase [Peptococcaceae bacterium]